MHKIAIPQPAIDRVLKRRDQLHVFNDIDAKRTAHIVVDLQNGFMAPGQPAEIPVARDIVPNVNRISAALRKAGGLVVYVQNTIDDTAKDVWSNWFAHMSGNRRADAMTQAFTPGSFGHSLWPELDVLPGDIKVLKNRFGAFVPCIQDHIVKLGSNLRLMLVVKVIDFDVGTVRGRLMVFNDLKYNPQVLNQEAVTALPDDDLRVALILTH